MTKHKSADESFNCRGFLDEVDAYCNRHDITYHTLALIISGEKKTHGSTYRIFRGEVGLSLGVACKLASVCDISLDKYVRHDW